MSEEKLTQDVQKIDNGKVVEVKKGKYVFLEIVVFILTVLFSQFGTNIIDALVLNGLGSGFRMIIIFIGFIIFYPARKVVYTEKAMTFKEAKAVMKDEYSKLFGKKEAQSEMTKEEKKFNRKIMWSFFKFMLAVLFCGAIVELVISLSLLRYMNL